VGVSMSFGWFSWKSVVRIPALWNQIWRRSFFTKCSEYLFFDIRNSNMVSNACLLSIFDSKTELVAIWVTNSNQVPTNSISDSKTFNFRIEKVEQTNILDRIRVSSIKKHLSWTFHEKTPSQSLIPQSWNPRTWLARKPPKHILKSINFDYVQN